jgi:hypothetical protein
VEWEIKRKRRDCKYYNILNDGSIILLIIVISTPYGGRAKQNKPVEQQVDKRVDVLVIIISRSFPLFCMMSNLFL